MTERCYMKIVIKHIMQAKSLLIIISLMMPLQSDLIASQKRSIFEYAIQKVLCACINIFEHIFWIHNQKLIRLGGKLKCGFVPSLDKYTLIVGFYKILA